MDLVPEHAMDRCSWGIPPCFAVVERLPGLPVSRVVLNCLWELQLGLRHLGVTAARHGRSGFIPTDPTEDLPGRGNPLEGS